MFVGCSSKDVELSYLKLSTNASIICETQLAFFGVQLPLIDCMCWRSPIEVTRYSIENS